MKNVILLLSLLFSVALNAQAKKSAVISTAKAPIVNRFAAFLKVNVTVLPNVTVNEHWQHTDLFTFKVIQANVDFSKMGAPASTGFSKCNMLLTEIKGFQVSAATNMVTVNADGSRVYFFNITGLKAQQEYGIDLIVNPEYLVAKPGDGIVVNYTMNGGDCSNRSVVNGNVINIVIGAGALPR